MTLRIHIDRLVLDGFHYSARDAGRLESTLLAELAHRLSLGGISDELRAGGSVDALRPAHIFLPEKPSAAESGRAIARAIDRGIGK
jgi:hypothetical protein